MLAGPQEKKSSAGYTMNSHHYGLGTAAPTVSPTQVPGVAPVPSISQVPQTAAPGSASAIPKKKYSSMQEAQQELQAVVTAMQALQNQKKLGATGAQDPMVTPQDPTVSPQDPLQVKPTKAIQRSGIQMYACLSVAWTQEAICIGHGKGTKRLCFAY